MEIVCLHGMGRTRYSMLRMARYLRDAGHTTHLFGYKRRASLTEAAKELAGFLKEQGHGAGGAHLGFVGHSAGGVLLRYLAVELPNFRAGRSVALGSPLAGSVLAQHYSERWLMKAACGPILGSLHPAIVETLPLPPCELGAIAGTAETALLPASLLLRPIADGRASDSTVLVEETRVEGLVDWIDIDVVHTLLPLNAQVHKLVVHFLEHGRFEAVP